MSRTGIIRAEEYAIESVERALMALIDNTDFPSVEGKTVLLKPNVLSDVPPEKAITTHPVVVEAMIRILKGMNAMHIIVGDSPGMQTGRFRPRLSGIEDVVERTGVELADFSKGSRIHQIGKLRIPMAEALDRADVVISLAKMKTHQLMYATGAVKNMFGTIPGLNKSPLHLRAPRPEEFASLLIAIFRETHADYGIIDGIIGMEGPGPSNGNPRKIGLLLGGENLFALDKAEAEIMGYSTVPLIKQAEKEMPGCTDTEYPLLTPEEAEIKGFVRIPEGKGLNVRSLFMRNILSFFGIVKDGRPYPKYSHDKCRRCRKCIEVCPAKALTLKNGKVTLDKHRCIRCYCCHEMCPFDAIDIT